MFERKDSNEINGKESGEGDEGHETTQTIGYSRERRIVGPGI